MLVVCLGQIRAHTTGKCVQVDLEQEKVITTGDVGSDLVSRGHTPFRKRGKGSGNFRYSSLRPRTVECGTNHSTVFCHMTADAVTRVENCEVRKR